MRFKYTKIISILSVILFALACRKNEQYIPNVNVDIYININNPSYFHLTSISGWDTINGGSKGLIAYRASQEEIIVYDRHCTYKPDESDCAAASVNSDNVTVDCCDGSKYLLNDGSVLNGPANFPLHRYRTTFDGTILHIFN